MLFDISPFKGVDAVHTYLRAIQVEQIFLNQFDKNYVARVLEKYDCTYDSMIENICGIVLPNTLGHIAIKKPLNEFGFREEEYRRLSDIFNQKTISDIERLIKLFIKAMVSQLFGNDASLAEYLYYSAKNTAVRIDTAVQYMHLEKIFLL